MVDVRTSPSGPLVTVSGGGLVDSVFGRVGIVVAVAGDYDSDQVDNLSGVSGPSVSDALDALAAAIVPAPVDSVFGRTGAVVAVAGDYDSDEVTNASGVTGATVSDALDALDAGVRTLTIVPTLGTLGNGPSYTTFTVDSGTIPSLAGLAIGDSVSASMRNNHDVDGYALIQASVRAVNSIELTFLRLDVGTLDVGIVTLDLGIIEA